MTQYSKENIGSFSSKKKKKKKKKEDDFSLIGNGKELIGFEIILLTTLDISGSINTSPMNSSSNA